MPPCPPPPSPPPPSQPTLLLEVCFVDARKALDDDGDTAQVAGLQGSMLPGRALTIVLVSHNHPRQALLLVVPARGRG